MQLRTFWYLFVSIFDKTHIVLPDSDMANFETRIRTVLGSFQVPSLDAEAANRMLRYKTAESSIASGWLEDESRNHSTAIYKQGLRTRPKNNNTKGDGKGKGKKGKGKEE